MDPFDQYEIPFFIRYRRALIQTGVILLTLAFYVFYITLKPFQKVVDLAINPAVAGVALVLGKVSSLTHRTVGLDLGFFHKEMDPEFLFRVRLAKYVTDRKAGPLVELAVDSLASREKREAALKALLKFESTSDWIQPFLNELFKGGMLELNEEKSPLLDELMKRVRQQGGIKNSLVRAYADVVFSFMAQVPERPLVRSKAIRWLPDIMPEDALFVIVPRLELETDSKVRQTIVDTLWSIQALSDPQKANAMLIKYYRKPPWPELKTPLAAILARLGADNVKEYLEYALKDPNITEDQKINIQIALTRKPFPQGLKISNQEEKLMAQREQARRRQFEAAFLKQESIKREEKIKQMQLAKAQKTALADAEEKAQVKATKDEKKQIQMAKVEKETIEPESLESTAVMKRPRKGVSVFSKEKEETEDEPQEKKVDSFFAKREERKSLEEKASASKKQLTFDKKETTSQAALVQKTADTSQANKTVATSQQQHVTLAKAEQKEKLQTVPKPFLKKEFENDGSLDGKQMAYIPKTPDGKPIPEKKFVPKPQTDVGFIDMVFEIKEQPVPIYSGPGYDQNLTGKILAVGSKGKAKFKIKNESGTWYQVASKQGDGWVDGNLLKLYDLSPGEYKTLMEKKALPVEPDTQKESTFFEPVDQGVVVYDDTQAGAAQVAKLDYGSAYLSTKSRRVGADRWFYLELDESRGGWAQGTDLQLSNFKDPVRMNVPQKKEQWTVKKSAFAPEWIVAGVPGVGVYNRASIAAELVQTISPPQVYPVLEAQSGKGTEWYKIQLSKKKSGWVQSMDVNLTEPKF